MSRADMKTHCNPVLLNLTVETALKLRETYPGYYFVDDVRGFIVIALPWELAVPGSWSGGQVYLARLTYDLNDDGMPIRLCLEPEDQSVRRYDLDDPTVFDQIMGVMAEMVRKWHERVAFWRGEA